MADRLCPGTWSPCGVPWLPVCGGMIEPNLCSPRPNQLLIDKSKFYSSQQGWPVVVINPPPPWVAKHRLVAPAGCLDLAPGIQHRGRVTDPALFRVTAAVAHLNTPEPLALVVELLRLQTERPYIIIVDTGSDPAVCGRLEDLRADDLEVHYLRAHSWDHSSSPVAAACDLALDLCRTDHLFYTHTDCFLMRRELLAELTTRCSARNPLVGYRLTERDNMDEWRWMVGHTCLMVHWPTAARIGARWSRRTSQMRGDLPAGTIYDTEYGFNWSFRNAGIGPDFLGDEENYARNRNADFDHPRSYATSAIYGWVGDPAYRAKVQTWMSEAMTDARTRIDRWRKPRVPLGATQPSGAGRAG